MVCHDGRSGGPQIFNFILTLLWTASLMTFNRQERTKIEVLTPVMDSEVRITYALAGTRHGGEK